MRKIYAMQRKLSKNNVYNAGKNSTNQELVFQHMCNHYRRILNAKKTIDTSPPYCYKARKSGILVPANSQGGSSKGVTKAVLSRNTSPALTERSVSTNSYKGSCWGTESYVGSSRYHAACCQEGSTAPVKYTCIDMELVDRIAFDTKNGPAAYRDEGWMEIKTQHNDKRFIDARQNKSETNSTPNSKLRLPHKALSELQQKRKFPVQFKNEKNPELAIGCSLEAPQCKCTKICVCDSSEGDFKKQSDNPKEQSQTSSRDSAYNGGVSSLPESRSPTPDQRRKKECCCLARHSAYYCEKKEKVVTLLNDKEESSERAESPPVPRSGSPRPRSVSKSTPAPDNESLEKMKQDALYVTFIQDITVEVLEKCLYTNKALKRVMKKHVLNNLKTLDKDRMIREVEKLRIQLGIPEDKNFLKNETDSEENCSDVVSLYPVISDSEFVLPKNLISSPRKGVAREKFGETSPGVETAKSLEDLPKSVSDIILRGFDYAKQLGSTSDDDGPLSTVIEAAKGDREEGKGKSIQNAPTASPRGGSPARKSVKKTSPRRTRYSSSESEDSGEESPGRGKKGRGRDGNSSSEEVASLNMCTINRSSSWIMDKKKQNVTFKDNNNWRVSRNVDINQKKMTTTTTCCRKSSAKAEPREKSKEY